MNTWIRDYIQVSTTIFEASLEGLSEYTFEATVFKNCEIFKYEGECILAIGRSETEAVENLRENFQNCCGIDFDSLPVIVTHFRWPK